MKDATRELQILLCHLSTVAIARMQRATSAALIARRIITATSLTDAYHIVEHQRPDCIILQSGLAACPDFELLGCLLKKLGVGCVIWYQPNGLSARLKQFEFHHFEGEHSMAALKESIFLATPHSTAGSTRSMPSQQIDTYDPRKIVMIGASTGGVDALTKVLCHFNAMTPPTLVVLHTGARFISSLIRLLDGLTGATVQVASHDLALKRGHVYLAPTDTHHLTVSPKDDRRIALAAADPVNGHRPSIDALFKSGASIAPHIVAGLLTGMGQDGARGLLALRSAGAHTIVQDQATSVVYGMPRVAAELGAAIAQLPIDHIGPALLKAARPDMRL